VAHGALRCALVERSSLFTTEAPPHAMTQHRGPRLVDVSGEVIHLLPRRGVQTGIQADAGAGLV
jgi:hypothetical protein